MNLDFTRVLKDTLPLLFEGTKTTISIALISIFAGLLVGFVSCLMGISKNPVLRAISKAYVWIIRGTPMIVQAFFVFYAIPQFFPGIIPSPYVSGIVTLTLNAGAYLSEIIRGGIQAVPVGQTEAARSLGLSSFKTMIKVVLPQAFKIAIPSMVNQFIITVKDTSILSVISLNEIVNNAKKGIGMNYRFFETYIVVAIFYLVIISALMVLSNYIEKRLNNERKG
ncbi:MAG: amino acid ABC transporter permease [Ruminococcaceae bacterium]|nr:amino acid ABC transporter permease [Oscillospiraceae bacterium]